MTALLDPVSRTTIFTRNMERALAFYRDLMGLAVFIDNRIPNPGASQILGQPCEAIRVVILRARDTAIGNIGLAEAIGARPPLPIQPVARGVTIGEPCLVIRTDHLKTLLPKLRAFGVAIISEPTKLVLPIKDEVWEMFLRDPDGTLLNLSFHGAWQG
ncbi:MAG: VOC family protein [Alphaproteobacteria bacterium]|nr:VOC family protein [Alphaproteobacteria bacterium]